MAAITPSMVKELREKTGAGMMDCKKALEEAAGDMEAAHDELRKRGQAIVNKRAGRAAKEGLIFSKVEGQTGVLVELNCETDFVARNDEFRALGNNLVEFLMTNNVAADALNDAVIPPYGKTARQALEDLIAKIGENMSISRFAKVDASQGEGPGFVQCYIHPPGKLGVLLELRTGKAETAQNEAFLTLAKDLTMQIAAASPVCVSSDEIPADLLDREKAIYADQAKMEGKPEKIWDKIIEGKVQKFFKDSCLNEQSFVKDQDITVKQLLEKVGKEVGDTIKVARFERIAVGAGAKQEDTE